MKINYEEIARSYDDVRSADLFLIEKFSEKVSFTKVTRVLDFGCGTGNYTNLLARITGAQVYGAEPADAMRERAAAKNQNVIFKKGNHQSLPFPDGFFDFIYMTDVIHHVPEIGVLFLELNRVLKEEGKICIATESHQQITERFYVKYFPTTALVDKRRYPKIEEIISAAKGAYLQLIEVEKISDGEMRKVDTEFLELVEKKGYSMFHLIPTGEYRKGLAELRKDLEGGEFAMATSGGTLVWLERSK